MYINFTPLQTPLRELHILNECVVLDRATEKEIPPQLKIRTLPQPALADLSRVTLKNKVLK